MAQEKKKEKSETENKNRIVIILAAVIAIALFCTFQNKHLVVSNYVFESDKIGKNLDGFRIVQISDLHNDLFGPDNRRLLDRIEKCAPDVIVITGDLVDSNRTDTGRALTFVNKARRIAPIYFVTGNHEHWLDSAEYDTLLSGLENEGTVILNDDCFEIERGSDRMWLVGLDDKSLDNSVKLGEMIEGKEELTVLLAHEPQYLKYYANTKVDLVLAGHAHGGQIRLPFVGGLAAPDQGVFPQITAGVYLMGDTEMIVSRGLGNSIAPIRLFNYPEVVCVELKSKER